jgi:hypothetical protein
MLQLNNNFYENERQFHFILTIGLTNLKKDNVCIKRYKGNEN